MPYSDLMRLSGTISFAEVRRHLEMADVADRCAILDFIRRNPKRIRPLPDDEWMCEQSVACYLDCITHEPIHGAPVLPECDDSLLTPFEAAWALVRLFSWLLHQPEGHRRAASIVSQISQLFRQSNAKVQNVIETGFLEHVLEYPEARPLFTEWANDPVLRESYLEALSWGLAHTQKE